MLTRPSLLLSVLFLLIFRIASPAENQSNCSYELQVSNDGPVTLDVPVSVTAVLDCADNETEYQYKFECKHCPKSIQVAGNGSISKDFIFKDHVGLRTVHVTAYDVIDLDLPVASGKTTVHVGEHISGSLNFSKVIEDDDGRKYVGTGRKTNITVHLRYPERVLLDSEFAYSWTIGEEHFSTDHPYKEHRFTDDGLYWVRVSVVGRIPSYEEEHSFRYKWGYFNSEVTVKDPFSNINISGNTYLEHGQLLDLDISCNGSGPIEYCWKILPPKENKTNLSCTEPVATTDCSFPILYYFRDSGDYTLAIYVNNWVTSMQRNVKVHIYDVSLRPQLSTVIIPVVCTVLVVLILATAVLLHMRRHPNFDVETADFDFMHENSTLALESSWAVMRRSLLHLIQLRCLCYPAETEAAVNYGTLMVNVDQRTPEQPFP